MGSNPTNEIELSWLQTSLIYFEEIIMATFLFGTCYINKELCSKISLETKDKIFEIAISAEGKEYFFYNSKLMIGFPIDGNVKHVSKIHATYNKYKDKMQEYCISLDNNIYWELKDSINT